MLAMVLRTGWVAFTIISTLRATPDLRITIRTHHLWTKISYKWTNFSKHKPMNKSKKRKRIRNSARRKLPKIR